MKPLLALLSLLLPLATFADTTSGTAITSLPVAISTPGTYYFTGDLHYATPTGTAILVESGDVIIDMNGHQLIATGGAANAAIGIKGEPADRIAIRDGAIRAFRNAVMLTSSAATLCGLTINGNYESGITLIGDNAQIVNNRICNTGGSTAPVVNIATGISLTGTFGAISGNTVENTFAADAAGHYADGIFLEGCSAVAVNNNTILGLQPATPSVGSSAGIATDACANVIFMGNTVVTSEMGLNLSGAASGKYGDNTTAGVKTAYYTEGSGMVNIGNNN